MYWHVLSLYVNYVRLFTMSCHNPGLVVGAPWLVLLFSNWETKFATAGASKELRDMRYWEYSEYSAQEVHVAPRNACTRKITRNIKKYSDHSDLTSWRWFIGAAKEHVIWNPLSSRADLALAAAVAASKVHKLETEWQTKIKIRIRRK